MIERKDYEKNANGCEGLTLRVISISLPEPLLQKIERVPPEHGYRGRSEVIRAALRPFLQNLEEERQMRGRVVATLTLRYSHDAAQRITQERHHYSDVIKSLTHTHTASGACLEILLLEGRVERIRSLVDSLRGRDGVQMAHVVYVDAVETPEGQPVHLGRPPSPGGFTPDRSG